MHIEALAEMQEKCRQEHGITERRGQIERGKKPELGAFRSRENTDATNYKNIVEMGRA